MQLWHLRGNMNRWKRGVGRTAEKIGAEDAKDEKDENRRRGGWSDGSA